MQVFTKEEIDLLRSGNSHASWVSQLCDSHEALRKERDELINKYERVVLVDRCTVREVRRAYGNR